MSGTTAVQPRKQIYLSLRARYVGTFCLMFFALLVILWLWFYNFGLPVILERATNAFDVSAAVSSVTLDAKTVSMLRENFVRALELQVLDNASTAGVAILGILFAASVAAISASVAYAQRNISELTEAARQVAGGKYDIDLSHLYSGRTRSEVDELARAIEASGRAHLREQKLQVELAELKIQIDHLKRDSEVSKIVETDNFKELKRKAAELRRESAESDSE